MISPGFLTPGPGPESSEEKAKWQDRLAWIATLPKEISGAFIQAKPQPGVFDRLGNWICPLPKTGSTVEEVAVDIEAAQEWTE